MRSTRAVGERCIHLVDGAFEGAQVDLLDALLRTQPLRRTDYDDESAREFLHLKCEWLPGELSANPLLRMLSGVVDREIRHLYDELRPEIDRVHLNCAPYGDHFTAHTDSACGVTAIYFANREWRDEWHGETLFYSAGEAVTAVAPRPGRLVLLPGDLVHRVGAPSRLFAGARMTVAFKYNTQEQPA